jgi:succinyl-CoA synthetase beta subunit
MASASGGMNIEEIASATPEKILTEMVDPLAGMDSQQARKIGRDLGLNDGQVDELEEIIFKLISLMSECDASLIEINPLIVNSEGHVIALDGKITIEDNALFRQERLEMWRDEAQENSRETEARKHNLSYVSLDGNIACLVNGAGLAMATMDLIKLHGGEPANFLDVGGGATAERVTTAFKIILTNANVEAILVNIFGGIVRCDLIAQGIIAAVRDVGVKLPVVVRLEGTNVEEGRALIAKSGLGIEPAKDLTEAAQKAVNLSARSRMQ